MHDGWHVNAGAREVQLASDCSSEVRRETCMEAHLCVSKYLCFTDVERNLKIRLIEPSLGRARTKLNMIQL